MMRRTREMFERVLGELDQAQADAREARREVTQLRIELSQAQASLSGELSDVAEQVRRESDRVLDSLRQLKAQGREHDYFAIAAERADAEEDEPPVPGALRAEDATRRIREMTGLSTMSTEELRRRKNAWKAEHEADA